MPNQDPLRDAWLNRIVQSKPTAFVTLAFKHPQIVYRNGKETTGSKSSNTWRLTDNYVISTAETLFTRMSKNIYGNKIQQLGCLQGIGSIEYQSHIPHLHLCLTNDIDPGTIKNTYARVIKSARRASTRHGIANPFRHLTLNHSLDVQRVHDDVGVSDYVTKLFNGFQGSDARMFELGVQDNKVIILH